MHNKYSKKLSVAAGMLLTTVIAVAAYMRSETYYAVFRGADVFIASVERKERLELIALAYKHYTLLHEHSPATFDELYDWAPTKIKTLMLEPLPLSGHKGFIYDFTNTNEAISMIIKDPGYVWRGDSGPPDAAIYDDERYCLLSNGAILNYTDYKRGIRNEP